MLYYSIIPMIFMINVVPARHISLADLPEVLGSHPFSPLFIVVKTDNPHALRTNDSVKENNLAMLIDQGKVNIVELEEGPNNLEHEPSHQIAFGGTHKGVVRNKDGIQNKENKNEKPARIKKKYIKPDKLNKVQRAERAIGYWLQKTQVKDATVLQKLRDQLALLKNKYKMSLRSRTREYQQRSNREVYEYLKRNRDVNNDDYISTRLNKYEKKHKSTTVKPKSKETKKACDELKGPISTLAGVQWEETTEQYSDECNSKGSGSTKGYKCH